VFARELCGERKRGAVRADGEVGLQSGERRRRRREQEGQDSSKRAEDG
jgi:hypothetical protein